jgi:hypothetical protein
VTEGHVAKCDQNYLMLILPPNCHVFSACVGKFNALPSASRFIKARLGCRRGISQSSSIGGFAAVGVRPAIATSLQAAFQIVQPTPLQTRLIRAILDGHDILLKDETGSGKLAI